MILEFEEDKFRKIKQARLDYFLVSEETFQCVSDCEILPGYRTDHSGVLLTLKLETIIQAVAIGNSITLH